MRYAIAAATVLTLTSLAIVSADRVQAQDQKAANLAPPAGWGTIKGQIIYGGEKIPERQPLDVNKDQEHCLAKGPILSREWMVNPKSKGLKDIVVFLNLPGEADELKPVIHPNLAKLNPPEFVIDQPMCMFEPRVFVLREGQKLIAKNSSTVAHNVDIRGLDNTFNQQVTPKRELHIDLLPETNAIKVSCGAHPWMSGWCWVLRHPYYAVTDADGKFEIKNAPAGARNLVIWHETGYLGGRTGRNGRPIEVKADGVTDLGQIEFKPATK